MNPGSATTFPWLSTIARNYQEYQVNGCVYEYVSNCSATTFQALGANSLGSVILVSQYNTSDPGIIDKYQAENTFQSISVTPDKDAVHIIECDPASRVLNTQYVWRPSVVELETNSKWYNMCRTFIFWRGHSWY